MHNDGRIWDVLDDLVNTGISAFHPVERAAGMDLARVKEVMANAIIVDGRNVFEPAVVKNLGFEYYSIGRK